MQFEDESCESIEADDRQNRPSEAQILKNLQERRRFLENLRRRLQLLPKETEPAELGGIVDGWYESVMKLDDEARAVGFRRCNDEDESDARFGTASGKPANRP